MRTRYQGGGFLIEPEFVPDRQAAGVIVVDGQEVARTLQCVHCGQHWVPVKGSGRVRGFCRLCMGPVCGPDCAGCVPTERMLQEIEAKARGA